MTQTADFAPDPLFDLTGRVVLLLGGGGGLGQHIARMLANRGAELAVFDLDTEALAALQRDLPEVMIGTVDIRDEIALRAMRSQVIERFGRVDCAINAAGVLHRAPALDLSVETFRDCLDINLTGAFAFSRVMGETMMAQGHGRILHLASVSSTVANEEYAAYAASKAGLSQLVRVLAREWARHGVQVNAIGPSLSDTDMTRAIFDSAQARAAALSAIPMGRFCDAADLDGTILLLLGPAGRYITGQTIFVDGGRTLT